MLGPNDMLQQSRLRTASCVDASSSERTETGIGFGGAAGLSSPFTPAAWLGYNVPKTRNKKMKVIFIEDVPNVGRAGEIRDVADGYGRNYLIPKKLAAIASESAIGDARAQMEKRVREKAKTESELRQLAAQIDGKEVVVMAKTGGKDKLYGSVTSEDIAFALLEALDVTVDKRKIEMSESIRQVGSYDVTIRLGTDIAPSIKVIVKQQES